MLISIIICTHNPLPDYLQRVLQALQAQTLPRNQWELLLIDNASKAPLAKAWDLCWHPHAWHIREDELGLTPARLRGIKESKGELLIFVDDDNLLAPNYLEESQRLANEWPFIGCWGGTMNPEFEKEPAKWIGPHLPKLALYKVERAVWSNLYDQFETTPSGAGMVVRRHVAVAYSERTARHRLGLTLDRRGQELGGCGDMDLAYCAIDLSLGTARFPSLSLVHCIPRERLTLAYLLRHGEANHFSLVVLANLRASLQTPRCPNCLYRLIWYVVQLIRGMPFQHVLIRRAEWRGIRKAKVAVRVGCK